MSKPYGNTNNDELRDRLVDLALRERIGGETPPDLSTRILGGREMVTKSTSNGQSPKSIVSGKQWCLLALAASLLVGVTTVLLMPNGMRPARTARFEKVAEPIPKGEPMVYSSDEAWSERKRDPTAQIDEIGRRSNRQQTGEVEGAESSHSYADSQQPPEPASGAGVRLGREVTIDPSLWEWEALRSRRRQPARPPRSEEETGFEVVQEDQSGQFREKAPDSATENFSLGTQVRQEESLKDRSLLDLKQIPDEQGQGPGNPGDQYNRIHENPFYEAVGERAVSTFSIDVDRAAYTNVRQFLTQAHRLPPPDAVRIEELVNYFDYDYDPPAPDRQAPFAANVEVAGCPWEPGHRLVRIGIKGRELEADKRPQSNLVFLIDVSGSMNQPGKLPLVVDGMKELAKQLGENDRVAIVVYASSEGLVLPSTPGTEQEKILGALNSLRAGGSTAGGAGIQLAYQIAEDNLIEGGVNRVILCTDGDFNVGTTSTAELERMVQQKAKDSGVFLSVLGFGRGNLNDAMMETISNRGNGNYHYVDTENESRRVLVEEMTGMLVTIAKDVKIQVWFNPAQVGGYRLIGYENRILQSQDFNDDTKDAGEIGAGHTVTALYEIVPADGKVDAPTVDESPYVAPAALKEAAVESNELLTLRMRFKQPDGDTSMLREWPVTDQGQSFTSASKDFQFAAAVAGFGMLLRDSKHRGNATWDAIAEIAAGGLGEDPHGRRQEFVEMIRQARSLSGE